MSGFVWRFRGEPSVTQTAPVRLSSAYRAVWRWHFYAGLLVLPVLCLMALTGGLYLFKPEIEAALYRDMAFVPARAESVAPAQWTASAEEALQGRATSVRVGAPGEAVQIAVSGQRGERTAFVDPHDGRFLGSIEGTGVMGVVMQLHSLSLFGRPFNILVEIVAGWAIILVATGIFLWWPRKRDAAVVVPRLSSPSGRPFWRDLHAVTGLYVGAIVAFLAVTGMPWSAVWGDVFLSQMRASGLGRPAAPAAASPWQTPPPAETPVGTGWTLEGAVLPTSTDAATARGGAKHEGHDHAPAAQVPAAAPQTPTGRPVGGLNAVIAAADAGGLARPYTVTLSSDPALAFTVSREVTAAEDARSLYVDADGRVVADFVWSDFGVGARAFEWGIAVHQGTQYGWINRIVMLLGCIGIWLLSVSAVVMWWKRRPKGSFGAPVAPPGPRVRAAVLGIVLPLAVLYPLTGLSLLIAIGVERVIALVRNRPAKAAA